MFRKNYTNFVKASSPERCLEDYTSRKPVLSGEEARRIYLEEIKDSQSTARPRPNRHNIIQKTNKVQIDKHSEIKDKDLYEIVQNDDIDKLKCILDNDPDKLHVHDAYGWSLLMIACQANSVESAAELLKRGIDISVRDKAGNSARSLVIKNKNYALVDVLLQYVDVKSKPHSPQETNKRKVYEEYKCNICNKTFSDREQHLSSTLHNISASKGKKVPAKYVIPSSNKGYQLMLKGGWNRDSGLGRDGSGKKYPIKQVQKNDRKGLGHGKSKKEKQSDDVKHNSIKMYKGNYRNDRQFEINFRREFY